MTVWVRIGRVAVATAVWAATAATRGFGETVETTPFVGSSPCRPVAASGGLALGGGDPSRGEFRAIARAWARDGARRAEPRVASRPSDVIDLEPLIQKYGDEFDVDPALVRAVIRAESAFEARAVSPKGAGGLMQLMPRTAESYGVYDLHSAEENIRGGVEHLRWLLDRYEENVKLALAAYNAGAKWVDRHRGIPPFTETRAYVKRVLRYHREYRAGRH